VNNQGVLEGRTKAELIDLIGIYAKNWLALDGLWFQSVERKLGMDEAMFHDEEAWRSFAAIEARRLKAFLNLPERAGLEGLARALELRFYSNLNAYEIVREADRLVFRNVECRVQSARARKNMPFHPCKSVGVIDYTEFSKAIDDRIRCRCLSCYPEVTDEAVNCSWEFTLQISSE